MLNLTAPKTEINGFLNLTKVFLQPGSPWQRAVDAISQKIAPGTKKLDIKLKFLSLELVQSFVDKKPFFM